MVPLEANPLSRPPSELQAAALRCLQSGGIVVTGNPRAARSLRQYHAGAELAAGNRAWPTPLIHDWQSWLSILWKQHLQNAADAPMLLTPLQERAVWKRIASTSTPVSETIAKLASNAWQLLGDSLAHGERHHAWSRSTTNDAEIFRGWAAAFDRECRANHWISRSDLPTLLTQSIRQAAVLLPKSILLAGFDRLTPAQQSLLDGARDAGTVVTGPEIAQGKCHPKLVVATELRDELETCAWWARRTLEENPRVSVAVIVQGIDHLRGEIERTFRSVLMPESVGVETNHAMPFEFSLGTPLASVPLIRAALLILRWAEEPLQQTAVSWLTMSGFLGTTSEDLAEAARFDADVREHGQMPPEVSLETFARYAPRRSSKTVRLLLKRLRVLLQTAQAEGSGGRKKTFAQWTDSVDKLLRSVRWPGTRTLESVEYQARARWERLLQELAALGFDGGTIGWSGFVTVLDRYATEAIFAPESINAPIQIMGALESSGQDFDALWFLGADERQWPGTGQPNPLLPLWLQRKFAMPHSSIDADWALNIAITRRLAASAHECVFSYAMRGSEGDLRPSALLREAVDAPLVATSAEDLRTELRVTAKSAHLRLTKTIEDASRVPWPKDLPAGGADILRRQSACAFQSFAVRRLGAEELDAAERGLTALDRGNLVHDVLHAFWSQDNPAGRPMKSRADLFNASVAGQVAAILDHHIAEAFRKRRFVPRSDEWWNAYLRLEQFRLRTVLQQWLDCEMDRTDFTVEACEQCGDAEIQGLRLKLRVDRIDFLEEGGRLLFDYKTGDKSSTAWRGERPEEPQLPLYAVHGGIQELRGVFFAKVRAAQMDVSGHLTHDTVIVTNEKSLQRKLTKNALTETMLDGWKQALGNLAEQFLAGDAAVAPKSYPQTCKYCDLSSLCRVAETNVPPEAEEADQQGPSQEVRSID